MKFGSVQFYKRLILAGYLLLILVPLVAAVVLGFLYVQQKNRADALQDATLAELTQILQATQAAEGDTSLVLSNIDGLLSPTNETASFPYQVLYPHLYSNRPLVQTVENNTVYFTFDDGPTSLTPAVLEVLQEQNVQATFFVSGEQCRQYPDTLRAIAEAGHTIGIHTYTHDYDIIYSSVEAYLSDFEKTYSLILELTGVAPEIFRFPGGSVNAHSQPIYIQLVAELSRRGFVYFDWNASAQDAVAGVLSSAEVVNNVQSSAAGQTRLVVLMHDHTENTSTVTALQTLIEDYRERGFQLKALDNTVEPIVFYQ